MCFDWYDYDDSEHLEDLETRLKEEEAASHKYALAKNSRSGR